MVQSLEINHVSMINYYLTKETGAQNRTKIASSTNGVGIPGQLDAKK